MDSIKTTNRLLLIIAIPIVVYLLKTLSFIFIPLVFSMFFALLFLPLMRWFQRKKIPKPIAIVVALLIIFGVLKIGGELIQLSSRQILAEEGQFVTQLEQKTAAYIPSIGNFFGLEPDTNKNMIQQLIQKESLMDSFGPTLGFIGSSISMVLMIVFFTILWLAESINMQQLLNSTLLKQRHTSVKAFRQIEKNLIKFSKVKFFISLFTGIATALACIFFDVSFPIFWGLFAFTINFVQMIGSFITVILLSLFAFVQIDSLSLLFFFILSITAVQVLFGSVLEPIFMGRSFSINIITVLVMLMFWGYVWGVPGMIMAIPITVFLKVIMEHFPTTQPIAKLISGGNTQFWKP